MSAIKIKDLEWESIIEIQRVDSIRRNKKEIDTPKSNESASIISRAITNNKQGISSSNNAKNINKSILEAYKTAKLMPENESLPKILSKAQFANKKFNYKNFDEKKLIDSAQEINSLIADKAPLLELSISKLLTKIVYLNHLGARLELENDSLICSLEVGKDNRTGSNASILLSKKPNIKAFVNQALEQYDYSKKLAKPASGNYPVILCHRALSAAINPILFSLKGDNVYDKKSRYEKSLGKKELYKGLTIIDNPYEPNNRSYYDCEANKTKKTALVKNGVINSFIHDSFTSKKLGMANTHNSGNIMIKPSVSYHCVQIKGKDKFDQMVKSVKNGFLIYDLYPDHTINNTTGAFGQNSSTFYHVRNGEVEGLCKGYVIMGNSYELFKKDLEISKETRNDQAENVGAIKINAKILKN